MSQFLEGHYKWNGGVEIRGKGYRALMCEGHPRAHRKYVLEHILIAERALGKYLPDGAVVHHHNEDKTDNRNSNLVILQDDGYHHTIHKRMRAFKACGHADWVKCGICKTYDDLSTMYINTRISRGGKQEQKHRSCASLKAKQKWRERHPLPVISIDFPVRDV